MYWLIGMCVAMLLLCSVTAKKNSQAKSRFLSSHPKGVSMADLSRDVQQLLEDGQRIRALRHFRKDTGLGLKDAKELLDTVTA